MLVSVWLLNFKNNAGYNLNLFADIDECTEISPCEHYCDNNIGSYECSCRTGFQINMFDSTRCDGKKLNCIYLTYCCITEQLISSSLYFQMCSLIAKLDKPSTYM